MPKYFFQLSDTDTVADNEGVELADTTAARDHAYVVAGELMANDSAGMLNHDWPEWTMTVTDDKGREILSFPMADASPPGPKKSSK